MRYAPVTIPDRIWSSEIFTTTVIDTESIKMVNEDTTPCKFQNYLSDFLSQSPINFSGYFTVIPETGVGTYVKFSSETAPINASTLDAQWAAYDALTLSTIENNYLNMDNTSMFSDWRTARQAIKTLYDATTFASLSNIEKKIVSRLFIATKTERDSIYTALEQQDHSVTFHQKSGEARQQRYNTIFIYLYNTLHVKDSVAMALAPDVREALDDYLFKGVEGTVEDNGQLGIFDFILSRTGTIFENNGLLEFNYSEPLNNGQTPVHVQMTAKAIIIDGTY